MELALKEDVSEYVKGWLASVQAYKPADVDESRLGSRRDSSNKVSLPPVSLHDSVHKALVPAHGHIASSAAANAPSKR